jgi:hypothetical protein
MVLHSLLSTPSAIDFPNIDVSKEHEYLDRFLGPVPQNLQIDFLNRFIEYLTWVPKYVSKASSFVIVDKLFQVIQGDSSLDAMERHKGFAALFCLSDAAKTAFKSLFACFFVLVASTFRSR